MKFLFFIFASFFVKVIHCDYNKINGSLRLVQILFRHGERSPTETYINDPYKDYNWPGGFGFLSNRGKLQMYQLGLQIRNYYSAFLPEYYYRTEITIYSSYSDRCLISAQLVSAGLFTPVGEQIWNPDLLWQPTPIYYNPRNLDNIIVMKQPCKKYSELLKENINLKSEEVNKKYPQLYQHLTEHTGSSIKNVGDVELLYNTLEIEQINNLSLPIWTKKYYPEPMRTVAAESLAVYSSTPLMRRLTGGVFIKNVTDNIQEKIDNDTKKKLILFSGHDLTIVNVMRSLGIEELLKPDFAATLFFELHNINDQFEIRVLFKKNVDEDIKHLEIPKCPTPCSLVKFLEVLNPVLPANWNKECSESG